MTEGLNRALARNWWAVAVRGVAGIVFGVVALLMPAAALLTLAWLFSAYLLIDGVFAITASVRAAEHHERWGMLLLEGLLDLVMGVVIWLFPGLSILAVVLIMAGWALITGALMLASSFRLHGSHGRLWLALGGVVSLLWGIVLAVAPATGAVVLTWWLGIYAVVFGVTLVILAFRLRGRHMHHLDDARMR